MPKAVLDTTVLVSAFLNPKPGGASYDLLRFADQGTFELCLSEGILEETARVLLRSARNRRLYEYSDDDVVEYREGLARFATLVTDLPEIKVVARDPNDDAIVACAIAAGAEYLVTRDKDLLSLKEHEGILMTTPEKFLHTLRKRTGDTTEDGAT
jgi:putative PIN family toxin of toxin-antitoxin system